VASVVCGLGESFLSRYNYTYVLDYHMYVS
jgi:hypothetical protein